MVKRVSAFAFSIILAVGLLPLPAFADETPAEEAAAEETQWEPGTYVEHEAIAYVVDDGAQARTFSLGGDLLDGAETLVTVDAEAAAETLGDDAEAGSEAEPAARARTLALDGGSDGPVGRLVLVRDESKTTEELIAELESDPRVVFAEPNYLVGQLEEEEADPSGNDGADDPSGNDGSADSSGVSGSVDPSGDGTADASGSSSSADASGSSGAEGSSGSSDAATGTTFGSDADAAAPDTTAFQWGMSNNGEMGGVSQEDAVDIGYGDWNRAAHASDPKEVVVAVIDSGVDESNPDLSSVLWDEGEDYPQLKALGGDVHGFSTIPGTTSTAPIAADEGHGTHVAGIIAAEWNGQGTSGVASNVEIMSVRSEVSLASEMLRCINYVTEAAKAGVNVRVANCSWGMGANASRAFDVAFTQLGCEGVMAVFASGNSDSDMDATTNTISTLRDNPYVVVTDAIDASGALSAFSCYGKATTDVVAPGSTILSTWPTSDPQYLGEADAGAALYESFDEKTRVAEGVRTGGQQGSEGGQADAADDGQLLEFRYQSGEDVGVIQGGKRFDGSAALALDYDAETAAAAGLEGFAMASSSSVDLSGLAEMPRYLSIRAISIGDDGEACVPAMQVMVNTTDGTFAPLEARSRSENLGDAWSAPFYELPSNTNWRDFRIGVLYVNMQGSMTGGDRQSSPADGTVIIDSIGLGSDLVPYKYDQGTSMAAPAVSGAAAVLAGSNPGDSAAQLAARIKGAARGNAYDDVCSTGGYASVDGGEDPAPVPVDAKASEDGATVTVRGYFVPADVSVVIGGTECAVISRDDAAGDAGDEKLSVLEVQAPEGFAGGEQWVVLQAGDVRGRLLVEFGDIGQSGDPSSGEAIYYDDANLPVPPELDEWGGWQLAGFAGDVYALPRSGEFNADADFSFLLKYDPDLWEWSRVPLPSDEQLAAAGVANVASVAGATYQGALIVQITSLDHMEGDTSYPGGSYWRYTAEGTWEHLPVSLPSGAQLGMSALGSDGENLYVFGGMGTYGYPDASGADAGDVRAILRLDLEAGTAEQVGELIKPRHGSTQVAYRDGAFLVSNGQNAGAQDGTSMGVERIRVLEEAQVLDTLEGGQAEYPAGSLVSQPVRMSVLVAETGQLAFAPAAVADGFMVAGTRSDSGAADTYTLANEDGALPAEYGKLASSQRLLSPSALAYDGKLYVLAATTSAPYRVFSATAVETVAQPGDYAGPRDDDGDQGGTLESLASTGDPLGSLAVGVALVAAAAGGVCFIRSRVSRGRV